jgi:mRNA-degrading endonuclease RelE of RelBE toxin-antitoxin system
MSNKVTPTPFFGKKYKRLAKKYPNLGIELLEFENTLLKTPNYGEPLGGNIYKARLASKDKVKGKRGGFRVITYLIIENQDDTEIFLITIYDKSREGTIKKAELIKLVKRIFGN